MAIIARSSSPNQDEIIRNSNPRHLYNHEFGGGRFFQVVFEDENEVHIRLASRTMMKVVYIEDHDDIEGLEIIKLIDGEERQSIKFNKFNIAQLKEFLKFICEINLKDITERRIRLESDISLDEESTAKIKTLLSSNEGGTFIKKLLEEGIISDEDIVNTGYRKEQLSEFSNLLTIDYYWQEYKERAGIPNAGEEKTWQYFFKKNQWIFGYGLDYRYKSIIQDEFHASDTDADGSEGVITDFLIADKRYISFVEIKKPSTDLFKTTQNRSRSWKLSSELIESVSQILEQKASGQIKIKTGELYSEDGELIEQNSYDSKVFLIIGNLIKEENSATNAREWAIKSKTFELFRRDSRNIDIITYDELFERAKHIVGIENQASEHSTSASGDTSSDSEIDALPF